MPTRRNITKSPSFSRRARLRLSSRRAIGWRILPGLRWLAVTSLIISVSIGGLRWFFNPPTASALEFTAHIIGVATGAVGVNGISIADLDDDGDQDIITTGFDGVKLYENTGNFVFIVKIIDDQAAERSQILDLNKDGSPDILVTYTTISPSVKWWQNTGTLEYTSNTLASTESRAVAYAGDIDSDGSPDIVTASIDAGESVLLQRWMNNGSGTFTATTLHSDSGVTALTVGDADNDGYADIVTGGENNLERWDTDDGFTWDRISIDDGNANLTHIALGDPGNGGTWITTVDANTNEVVVYRGGTTESDYGTYQRLVIATATDGKTIAPIDLDGDGDLDLIVAAQDDNSVFWYNNNGTETFTKETIATGLQSVYGVAVGDLDGDGDQDIIAGDHFQGNVIAYERTRTAPVATQPTNIQQSTNGTGTVTFATSISDGDRDLTRFRVQYSLDGKAWDKPWITKITTSAGSADLKNSNGYQVGTSNSLDTDDNADITVTLTWDTKSVKNTGGPISGDILTVKLRILPRDDANTGTIVTSGTFQIDNQAPQGIGNLVITSINGDQATLSWQQPADSSNFKYKLYYGTDFAAVLEQRSDLWDAADDATMNDIETTSATITGLTKNQLYTFKLFVEDDFGNKVAAPSVRGTTTETATATPTIEPTVTTPATSVPPTAIPTSSPVATAEPSPTAAPPPTVLFDNQAPITDAGPDQIVNPSALVILDGTASFDPDPGDTSALSYNWRQLSGPAVELLSSRTATASFSAGEEGEVYVFSLTIRDQSGASATDTVTVATKKLPTDPKIDVQVGTIDTSSLTPDTDEEVSQPIPAIVTNLLHPANLTLFILSIISTLLLLIERISQSLRQGKPASSPVGLISGEQSKPQGKVVHFKTGQPIVGAQVLIYGNDGKLRSTQRSNAQGIFTTFFPVGQYTLDVRAEGYGFAPSASKTIAPPDSLIYSGGKLTVKDANKPLSIVIPMKPKAAEVTPLKIRLLHIWQTTQRFGRVLSWPLFLAGALLNTTLVFIAPRPLYLFLEILYIFLVIGKIALEVRVRPAYGLVRDAITHVPIDLAVVRLFDQKTNRLIMTRVANNQGKFFALPPAGDYTITISKPGYATFSKQHITIQSEHDTILQITADLMPIAPKGSGGLVQAAATVL